MICFKLLKKTKQIYFAEIWLFNQDYLHYTIKRHLKLMYKLFLEITSFQVMTVKTMSVKL